MIAHTKIISSEQINQFYIMATSFLEHHPNTLLYCLTDLKLKPIDGVVYLDRFENIDEYGDYICYVSPYLVFFGNVDSFFEHKFEGIIHPSKRDNVHADMFVYNVNFIRNKLDVEDNALNFSLPPYMDFGSVSEWHEMGGVVPVVNTREFEPWIVQRNSAKTLIFPWEKYFVAMSNTESFLDGSFIESVITNCQKHPYMLFYKMSGVLDTWND